MFTIHVYALNPSPYCIVVNTIYPLLGLCLLGLTSLSESSNYTFIFFTYNNSKISSTPFNNLIYLFFKIDSSKNIEHYPLDNYIFRVPMPDYY